MYRLISLEPSNTVTIRIEPGQRCFGVLTLRNVMHTMPVAFRARPVNKARYTVSPQSGIILPLATLTLEITYVPAPTHSNDNNLPEHFPHCEDDSFVLQSVLAPGASIKNPTSTHDFSVPNDWFTNKKKQVYTDSGIKIVFVGSWVLTYLVTKGCMDEIREILEKSEPMWKSVDSFDIDGQSLLHLAVSQGRADIVQLLLEFGPDVEALNRSGSSPLEAASASGDALIVDFLLAHKACPEKSRRSARGPIHLASGNGHVEVLKHLLQKGANVNSLTKDGNTALHLAVEERRRDCARLLLANSARTDVRNSSYGDTPLHVASTLGDEYTVKLLLHKGAYRDVRNKAGKTSYDLAAENGHAKLFDALRLGDDLCTAARKGELRMVLRMLERGASINGRDQKGFNGTAFLEKLRGKKLLFVGDSVNRNTWRSMLCMLESYLPSYSEKKLILEGSYYFFHSKEYNATIGFYWAPFLVESNNDDIGSHTELEHILRIKSISKHGRHWLDADILIFDSYGWWWHPYLILLWGSFGSSDAIYTKVQMKYRRYEIALSTWSDWLELQLNRTKTKVFFMSASLFHFSEGDLHAAGNCYEESELYLTDGFRKNSTDPRMTEVLKSTLQKLDERGIKVEFMNITYLSDFRKDAHVSIYHKKTNESTRPTEKEIYEGSYFLDCLHWCVPGLPDIWNEILYSYIMKLKL